jgi:ferredoxin
MAMVINDDCIDCAACVDVCPREAIDEGDPHYKIEAAKCTECKEEGESKCIEVCPVDCIVLAA